ncbi:uncharacterized protein LOC118208705 [Anguilla anguilla]|uniref:uncharacterized protein LOC118208705 n=1 Tax=Anguilla anguilla TaxID=7936 RepID=UPI0015ABDAFB|nr:uncharacterized protein LOC118208705 [Anguilla anguilla]
MSGKGNVIRYPDLGRITEVTSDWLKTWGCSLKSLKAFEKRKLDTFLTFCAGLTLFLLFKKNYQEEKQNLDHLTITPLRKGKKSIKKRTRAERSSLQPLSLELWPNFRCGVGVVPQLSGSARERRGWIETEEEGERDGRVEGSAGRRAGPGASPVRRQGWHGSRGWVGVVEVERGNPLVSPAAPSLPARHSVQLSSQPILSAQATAASRNIPAFLSQAGGGWVE